MRYIAIEKYGREFALFIRYTFKLINKVILYILKLKAK